MAREVVEGPEDAGDFCATFEFEGDENVWIQLTNGQINMAYPFTDDPMARVAAAGVRGRETLSLSSWEPAGYATFDHESGGSSLKAAEMVDQLFLHVLRVQIAEGGGYRLATEVFALSAGDEAPS